MSKSKHHNPNRHITSATAHRNRIDRERAKERMGQRMGYTSSPKGADSRVEKDQLRDAFGNRVFSEPKRPPLYQRALPYLGWTLLGLAFATVILSASLASYTGFAFGVGCTLAGAYLINE